MVAAAVWLSALAAMSWPVMTQQAACICKEKQDILLHAGSQQCLISSLCMVLRHADNWLNVALRQTQVIACLHRHTLPAMQVAMCSEHKWQVCVSLQTA